MKKTGLTFFVVLTMILISDSTYGDDRTECFLPIDVKNRQSWQALKLTKIGQFRILRKARPNIPAHLHTGIDIKRPRDNYDNEKVFPVMPGKIISMRDDGAYAQIIIEHALQDKKTVWTVYEHISGIIVNVGDFVNPHRPIARFMNKQELDRFGWQFDHFHFEILKIKPRPLNYYAKTPTRFFGTYCLECYTGSDLEKYYYSPKDYFIRQWSL